MKKRIFIFKRVLIFSLFIVFLSSCNLLPDSLVDAISGASKPMVTDGNSLFHQTDETSMQTGELEILGEVESPGKVNFNKHYKREVVIKEAEYHPKRGIEFIGAYRYKGYSLFDLLHPFNHDKKNADTFRPAIDLYIEIANDVGESVVFSFSEIFHTNIPHQVMIATEVAPIYPYRTDVEYPIAETWRVVAANDLFAWRVLENPVSVTVRSFDEKEIPIDRDIEPLFSPSIEVMIQNERLTTIEPMKNDLQRVSYFSNFYGMGMGYHENETFKGYRLQDVFKGKLDMFNPQWNRNGLVCFVGLDGYRAIYSYSELFNRTDQVAPILAVPDNPGKDGCFRIYHPAEFYADRSVKALKEMYFFKK